MKYYRRAFYILASAPFDAWTFVDRWGVGILGRSRAVVMQFTILRAAKIRRLR